EEPDALAVGGDINVLADVGAEEEHLVRAGLALDRVAAVTRVPLENVVAGAQEGGVVPLVAVDEVVAVAAQEHVGALAAEDHVVPRAASHSQTDKAGRQRPSGDAVIPVLRLQKARVGSTSAVAD